MTIKTRLIRYLVTWLFHHYRFIVLDIVIPPDSHVQRNWNWKQTKERSVK